MSGNDIMRLRIRYPSAIPAVLLTAVLVVSAGCAGKTSALFTRPELINQGQLAVLGLTPEQEQIFMACYIKAFPGQVITFVERNRLRQVVSERDLLQGNLTDRARAKIKQTFGVEAFVMCSYYDGSAGKKKLRVRIVDSENGAIVGSVITHAADNFEYHCITAIKALKDDLMRGSY